MDIKWNKTALKNLISALEFLEDNQFHNYSVQFENEVIQKIKDLPNSFQQYALDQFRHQNDGSFRVFFVDSYRISFRVKPNEIQILRIRHTSRKPHLYKK